MNKTNKILNISVLFFSLLLSACGGGSSSLVSSSDSKQSSTTPSSSQIPSSSIPSSSSHIHTYDHYLEVLPGCEDYGVKEFWQQTCCEDTYYLVEPAKGNFTDKEEKITIDDQDNRYIAPIGHEVGGFVRTKYPTYNEDGVAGHYVCKRCDVMFDKDRNQRDSSYFKLRKFKEEKPDLAGDILANDAIKSSNTTIVNNVKQWAHGKSSDFISVNNTAGWQLANGKYDDIKMKVRIEGSSMLNPDSGYCCKSFLIGAKPNPKAESGKEPGVYPVGYFVNVSQGTNTNYAGIQIAYANGNSPSSVGAQVLSIAKGDYENKDFYIVVKNKVLSLLDSNGNYIKMVLNANKTYTVDSINLAYYEGGSIGVFSWTQTSSGTEHKISKFHISEFEGVYNNSSEDAIDLAESLLDENECVSSNNEDIKTQAAKWKNETTDGHIIDTTNGYDSIEDVGSYRVSKSKYTNFELGFSIDGYTETDPKLQNNKIKKSILFGVSEVGEYFRGYSLTLVKTSSDQSLKVCYHDYSLKGTFIGEISGTFVNEQLSIKVINNRLHVFDSNKQELGGTNWDSLGGLKLENYRRGGIGVLCWDEVATKFYLNSIRDLDDVTGDLYSNQDESKRVNVFVLAGQSNMEGNTKAWNDAGTYLKNYCDNSNHDFDQLVKGYDNVQIALHNMYVPGNRHNFTNESQSMVAKFTSTKVGMGLDGNNYMGPELGIAERLTKKLSSDDNPIFLVKYASGGTSFASTIFNWQAGDATTPRGLLFNNMIAFAKSAIEQIEAMGYIPVIKGLLWHQGESDSGSVAIANLYYGRLNGLITEFRREFASYAVDNDPYKINFIDAEIYAGTNPATSCKNPGIINQAKNDVAKLLPCNYCIGTNGTDVNCVIGTGGYSGGDQWHYTVDSMIKLGNTYASFIYDNHMLDF